MSKPVVNLYHASPFPPLLSTSTFSQLRACTAHRQLMSICILENTYRQHKQMNYTVVLYLQSLHGFKYVKYNTSYHYVTYDASLYNVCLRRCWPRSTSRSHPLTR
jgi:hypothetical protein